jgi:FkbM family methyltransferase
MKRPLLLRLLPDRLRLAAWARLYRPPDARWNPLYSGARLRFAPDLSMDLVPGDIISDSIAFTGIWELALSRRLVGLAKASRHGQMMIDIGANLGYFSLLWAAAAPDTGCLSLEPSPRNIELLSRNISRNRLESRVQIRPFAAGRETGSLAFSVGPPDQTGWGGLCIGRDESTINVDVVRLDDMVAPEKEIMLLKIDAEGADTWVLMGCKRLLQERRIRHIWFEQNKPRMRKLGIEEGEAESFLRSVGYKMRPENDPVQDLVDWSASPV